MSLSEGQVAPVSLPSGRYRIVGAIGSGGMGTVYRADDRLLHRPVAIKVLSASPDGGAVRHQVLAEARAASALNHPNVCTIFEVSEENNQPFIVMEFVEGRPLSTLIPPGEGLPLDTVLAYGVQIAGAIAHAHERGIIHRDLKCANVNITPEQRAKVLDFGLALQMRAVGIDTDTSTLAVVSSDAGEGTPGTLLYTAPELLRGFPADQRSDIWALGVILSEMASGERPFNGKTRYELSASILTEPIRPLPPRVPQGVRAVIARCLSRDPAVRYHSAGEVRAALEALQSDQRLLRPGSGWLRRGSDAHQRAGPTGRERLLIGITLLAVIVSVGLGVGYYLQPRPSEIPFAGEWHVDPPPGMTLMEGGVLSPDGQSIAFVTIDEFGVTALWVQRLGSLDPQRLPGTELARDPVWSPDGKTIVFTADRKLKRMGLTDKVPQTLAVVAPSGSHRGGAWSSTGVLLLSPMEQGPLHQSRADLTTLEPVTRLEAGERVHLWPSFLPDGRHFLYRAVAFDAEQSGTYLASLDSPGKRTRLDGVTSAAVYAPPGYLLFVREGNLVAQRFDLERRRLEGAPVLVASNVMPPHENRGLTFSASGGVISYISGGAHRQLEWRDRAGRSQGVIERSIDKASGPALSPDGAQVLAGGPRSDVGGQIWVAPTTSGTPSRLDTGLPQSAQATWSPDGRSIAFTSAGDLYRVPAHGGQPSLLLKAPTPQQPLHPQDWSHDFLIYICYTRGQEKGSDLCWLSMADHHTKPFLQSPASESQGQLSPDMRWIAYTSDETGDDEVYVQRFPRGGSKLMISAGGGAQPQWRADGRELFYLSKDNNLMSVAVNLVSPLPGTRHHLFHIPLNQSLKITRNHYAVSRDGSRFLFNVPMPNPPPIAVRFNWTAALPH